MLTTTKLTLAALSTGLTFSAVADTFTTAANPDTTSPQLVVAPTAQSILAESAVIEWTTNEVADSRVYFGTAEPLLLVAGDIEYDKNHRVMLTKLAPETTYSYRIVSLDPMGNNVTSNVSSFTTNVATYTVTPNISIGGTVTPSTAQTVSTGTMVQFTTTAYPNFVHSNTISGTCPQGSWNGDNWTTGAVTANCTVTFSFLRTVLQNQWTLIGMPYSGTVTVNSAFGNDGMGTYATDWEMYDRNEANKTYVQLIETTALTQGNGYWLLSKVANPAYLSVADTGATPVSNSPPCDNTTIFPNGCFAIPLTHSGSKQYNLVSYPFTTPLDWADVRFEQSGTLYTPSAAETAGVASKSMWKYGSGSFSVGDDNTPGMNSTLYPLDGFWVKTLSNANGVSLLIPKP